MKRVFGSFALLAIIISGSIHGVCCDLLGDYAFYIKVGTGVSFSQSTDVVAPAPTWSPAIQGYQSKLGNVVIGDFALGCEFMQVWDFQVGISNRSTFKYRKVQTPIGGGSSYTREFDLDVTPVLFSATFLGRNIPCLRWDSACGMIYPLLGAGIGSSRLLITNFRTTGLPPSGGSFPFASFSSENPYTLRRNFTYTAFVGFEYAYNERWTLATGYRWFDAGRFKGPRFQRVSTGSAVDVAGEEWRMRFRSNEWFFEFKLFL